MNTKMASAVLATDECRKEMDDLRNIIQGISDEGQTLRKLVMDVKVSGALRVTCYYVILILLCSRLIVKVLKILNTLSQTWIQGSPIIKMLHRNLSIANQV
jgi:hypothetical protein